MGCGVQLSGSRKACPELVEGTPRRDEGVPAARRTCLPPRKQGSRGPAVLVHAKTQRHEEVAPAAKPPSRPEASPRGTVAGEQYANTPSRLRVFASLREKNWLPGPRHAGPSCPCESRRAGVPLSWFTQRHQDTKAQRESASGEAAIQPRPLLFTACKEGDRLPSDASSLCLGVLVREDLAAPTSGASVGLHREALDRDYTVSGLTNGIIGTTKWMVAQAGRGIPAAKAAARGRMAQRADGCEGRAEER